MPLRAGDAAGGCETHLGIQSPGELSEEGDPAKQTVMRL